jgi:hypothetical protein
MKLWIGCVCVAAILLIAIIGISVVIISREKYVLLGNMGGTQYKRIINPTKEGSVGSISIKYKGHRYDRHHVRSNPHVRRYQDSF